LAGGTEGMLIGAALGSTIVPGVGTVLGGAAGYAVGAGAGYLTAHFPKSDIRKKSSVQFIGNEQEL
jgi:membrane protein YqaA with SNARE-associated domain